ncbi:hypothetical protein KEM48_006393 [Puccinia striiformis f. sp. tritici PST-130]|nr:hypothetical protein KEM48_006393 [Puccinia striiformis f. sp. tritici PST-130]
MVMNLVVVLRLTNRLDKRKRKSYAKKESTLIRFRVDRPLNQDVYNSPHLLHRYVILEAFGTVVDKITMGIGGEQQLSPISCLLGRPKSSFAKSGAAEHADQPEHKEIDILVARFLEYKTITKGFIAYYEDLSKLETSTAAELQKIGGHLPRTYASDFGLSYYFAQTITQSTLHDLLKIKTDVKELLAELGDKPTQLATDVGKSRAESIEVISHLRRPLYIEDHAMALVAHDDPVLLHRQVEEQVKQQMNLENSLTRMIIEYQKKAFELEKRVNIDLQAVVNDLKPPDSVPKSLFLMSKWAISRKSILKGTTKEITSPINVGLLERKKRFTRNYKEVIISLHRPVTCTNSRHPTPPSTRSLKCPYLTQLYTWCTGTTVGQDFKWHIEGARRTSGGANTGSLNKMKKSLHIGSKEVAFSFKSRTHAEMMHWWELMQKVAQHSVKADPPSPTVKAPATTMKKAGHLKTNHQPLVLKIILLADHSAHSITQPSSVVTPTKHDQAIP